MNIDKIKNKLHQETAWFDIYSSQSESTSIKFNHSSLEEISQHEDSGTGIRLNKNGRTGFSYTHNDEMIEKAAEKALELSKFGEVENLILPSGQNFESLEHEYWIKFDKKTEIEKGEEVIAKIKKRFPEADVSVSLSAGEGKRSLVNSSGANYDDVYKYYGASVSALLVDESGSRLNCGYSDSSTQIFDIAFFADKIIQDLEIGSKTCVIEGGKVPVIFTPDAVSSMLSIILSGFSAKQIYKKLSPFCDKIGSCEFNNQFSIIDDPLVVNSPGSFVFDDEGVKAERKYIIKQGVIENIISDVKYAALLNIKPSGNSSRGYSGMPYSSFSNLIIEPGEKSFKYLSAQINNGIVADQFIGLGQSNTLTGDFSANLDFAYLVKNGEIQGRVKNCMVSGNIFEMLKNHIEVSSDLIATGGSKIPYLFFEKINLTV